MGTIRLSVDAAGDHLRSERLTRRLREHLAQYDGLDVDFAPPAAGTPDAAPTGAKGTADTIALAVALVPMVKPTASVLVTALDNWFERNKHHSVVVERDGTRVELTGHSSAAERQLLDRALGGEQGTDRDEPDVR